MTASATTPSSFDILRFNTHWTPGSVPRQEPDHSCVYWCICKSDQSSVQGIPNSWTSIEVGIRPVAPPVMDWALRWCARCL